MRIWVLNILLLFSGIVQGQIRLNCAVDKRVVMEGEILTYQMAINSDCQLTAPRFSGFDVVGGPNQQTNSSYSNINGHESNNTTYIYSYQLRATRKGEFTIEAPVAKCGNEKIEGKTIQIEVLEMGSISDLKKNKVENFVELSSSKKTVYVGEPFIISTMFYSRDQPTNIHGINQGQAKNLWRHELQLERTVTSEGEYFETPLSKEVAYALEPGELIISPYSGVLSKELDFFNSKRLEGISNSIVIEVLPLPDGAPDNFVGLVGDFELIFSINTTNVKVGEAIDLDLTIKGRGNLTEFPEPVLNFPESFHVYDPEIIENTNANENGAGGEYHYKFVISPEESGDFVVQPYSFAYFDIETETYKIASTEEFTIQVKSGGKRYGEIYSKSSEGNEEKFSDIQYITTTSEMHESGDFKFGSLTHFIGVSSPVLLGLFFFFIGKRKDNLTEADKQKLKNKNITKITLSAIEGIGEEGELYKLKGILEQFFMVKLKLDRASITINNLETELQKKGVKDDKIIHLKNAWARIDMSAFAPISDANKVQVISEIKRLIKDLSNEI